MEGRELSVVLRELARNQGNPLCDMWYGRWKDDTDLDGLLDMYIRGHDFCIENDYPTLDFIRNNFDRDELRKRNIILDCKGEEISGMNGTWIFLGDCDCSIRFKGLKAADIYIHHQSNVKVIAEDGSILFITLCDQSDVVLQADDWSRVRKYDKRKKEG